MATAPESPRPRPQRAWRALCPNCGAPVEFASAASASAVCSFCRSTLLREGDALRRIGLSAELFDDHSPLQLGAGGAYQGVPFTLVGRLQYRYADGTWNEWHALFEGSGEGTPRSGWLSEDNGALVLAFDQPPLADAPALDDLHAGERRLLGGQGWSVASVVRASLIAAQGELPRPPRLEGEFTVVDLRNERDEVGTLDDANGLPPQWSIGRSVSIAGLVMSGLREVSEAQLKSQGLSCPNCGAPLLPTLASTQSISCGQCKAVVDVSGGAAADLKAYAQNNSGAGGLEPQIRLGSTGRLALGPEGELDWQVVGFQERCDLPAPGDDDEQTFWREYLLYHRTAGFAFLVDADDGWSAVRPLTGAPQAQGSGANWQGVSYRKRYSYAATVTWVLGEFYWRVRRDERALVTDYDGPAGAKLSREQTGNEVTWSAGKAVDATVVSKAFGVPLAQLRRDAAPLSGLGLGNSLGTLSSGKVGGLNQGLVIFAVVVVVMILMTRCSSRDDCSAQRQTFGESSAEYQQCQRNARSGGFRVGGGSFGGFSSGGGGHK